MPDWLRLWLAKAAFLLAALILAAAVFGTPHVGWNYGCRSPPRYGETGCRIYDWCEYYGFQGRRVMSGEDCGYLVRLVPVDWARLFQGGRR